MSHAPAPSPLAEVVLLLPQPPLALAPALRTPQAHARVAGRLDLAAPASRAYLRRLDAAQARVVARVRRLVPSARARWHYQVVVDGVALVLPKDQISKLRALRGVGIDRGATYPAAQVSDTGGVAQIGAPTLWGAGLATAGQGIRIAILDDGVDQTHPYFDPTGYVYPAGFPLGNTAYTTAKVIVARSFAPPVPAYKYAGLPFDPDQSEHATHVAGIAAGNAGTTVQDGSAAPTTASGVAPKAYIGNYKVLTVPTQSGVGLDGNSPEIVAGIESAVKDRMDVINLSLGEPEVPTESDVVAQALDGAAAAGVVPVVAAGNDFSDFGAGSISSPGTARSAITAAATTVAKPGAPSYVANFSSGGPTPITLRLKPDVAAPGVNVLSSVPRADGLWQEFSGTSMATPHVSGSVALLRQRHPTWTVAQLKSALVTTGDPVYADPLHPGELSPLREGGGLVDLAQADAPGVFADPASLSFGLLKPGASASQAVSLTDAGAGAGPWTASVALQGAATGVSVTVPAQVTVPSPLPVSVSVSADAPAGDVSGFVVLQLGAVRRRLPLWLHVERPLLQTEPARVLPAPGIYSWTTVGGRSRVSAYRWPETPSILTSGPPTGPERVYRLTIAKAVANFGVVVLREGAGVHVTPRVVSGADENRLAGYPALPIDLNPWRLEFENQTPIAGAIDPTPGTYSVVFDTPAATTPGSFTFRYWVDDTTPPTVRLLTPAVASGGKIRFAVTDAGSGVDPGSIVATVDGKTRAVRWAAGVATIDPAALTPGTYRVTLVASDYQEAKNMENVGPILPNTRTVTATVTLR